MKVLTLTQPWATLVAIGAKKIETRSWPTSYRGPLAIHAAKGLGPVGGKKGLQVLCAQEPFKSVLTAYMQRLVHEGVSWRIANELPRGAVVAVCILAGCFPIWPYGIGPLDDGNFGPIPNDPEHRFGDYTPGRYAWFLSNIRALPEPIPCKGALGLWEWDRSPNAPQNGAHAATAPCGVGGEERR